MDQDQVANMLRRVTFQPFTIDVDLRATQGYTRTNEGVDFSITAIDSYHPGVVRNLHMGGSVPSYAREPEDFYDWCLGTLLWFAEHETREWFKVDGRPWRDPHSYPTQSYDERAMYNKVVREMRAPRISFSNQEFRFPVR